MGEEDKSVTSPPTSAPPSPKSDTPISDEDGDIVTEMDTTSTDDDSNADEDASTSQEFSELLMLLMSERVDGRETVIAEDFLPNSVIQEMDHDHDCDTDGLGLNTYWIYQPANAKLQTGFGLEDEDFSRKAIFFVSVVTDFVWSMGLTPVFQDVIMPVLGFSPELRHALHEAGWQQCKVDFNGPMPYKIFNDWPLVHLRVVQAKLNLSTEECMDVLQPLRTGDGESKNGEGFGPEWDSFTEMLRREHPAMEMQHIERNKLGLPRRRSFANDSIIGDQFHVLSGERFMPLHYDGRKKKLPHCLLKSANTPSELQAVPLTKHHCMRWSIIRGKVVKKRRRSGESPLTSRPSLSSVKEVVKSPRLIQQKRWSFDDTHDILSALENENLSPNCLRRRRESDLGNLRMVAESHYAEIHP